MENIDQFIFGGFVNEILDNIERFHVQGDYNMNQVIIWDNLRAHTTLISQQLLGIAPHTTIFLPLIALITVLI